MRESLKALLGLILACSTALLIGSGSALAADMLHAQEHVTTLLLAENDTNADVSAEDEYEGVRSTGEDQDVQEITEQRAQWMWGWQEPTEEQERQRIIRQESEWMINWKEPKSDE